MLEPTTDATTAQSAEAPQTPAPQAQEPAVDLRTLLANRQQAMKAETTKPADPPIAETAQEPAAEQSAAPEPVLEAPAEDPALARFKAMGFENVRSVDDGLAQLEGYLKAQRTVQPRPVEAPAPVVKAEPEPKKPSIFDDFEDLDANLVSQFREKVEVDGKQVSRWIEDTPAELKARAEKHALQYRQWRDVLANPKELGKLIREEIQSEAKRIARAELDGFAQQAQQQSAEAEILNLNPWLFEGDGFSKAGQAAIEIAQQFRAEGMSEDKALRMAIRLAKAEHSVGTAPAPAPEPPRLTPAQLEEQRRAQQAAVLTQAAAQPATPQGTSADRSGTFPRSSLPTPQRPQNGNMGLGGKLFANLGRAV